MTRRIIKDESDLDAFRETRPTVRRRFYGGAVLNVLQSVTAGMCRFTVEGEGMEVWCCPKNILDEQTIPAELTSRMGGGDVSSSG